MQADKRVQKLAKQLVQLVGKMDQEIGANESLNSQEAANMAFREELSKKNNKNINI